MKPLNGVDAHIDGDPDVAADAAHLLSRYGAAVRVTPSSSPASVTVSGRVRLPGSAQMNGFVLPCPGLPAAVPARAAGGLLALAALAAARSGGSLTVDAESVSLLLLQPLVMAQWYSAPPPARVTPLRVGDGWVDAALGAPGDAELFQLLCEAEPAADAEQRSAAAQEWRLPVVPYRTHRRPRLSPAAGWSSRSDGGPAAAPPAAARSLLADVRIVDVTAMWAGPLCTWLLAQLGASVVVVESGARPDGMRAPHGGGIYPHGRLVPGANDRSAMFVALASGKERVDLDLRRDDDRQAFDDLCAHADLRIDTLSHRARAQLGMDGRATDGLGPAVVHIPAFASGPARDWVAYGTQIHAISGLAWPAGAEEPIPAATAYVDALGGILGALAAVVALHARSRGGPVLTASLMDAVDGLPPDGDGGTLLRGDPTRRVAELAETSTIRVVRRDVGGVWLRHPPSPFLSLEAEEERSA